MDRKAGARVSENEMTGTSEGYQVGRGSFKTTDPTSIEPFDAAFRADKPIRIDGVWCRVESITESEHYGKVLYHAELVTVPIVMVPAQ